MLSILHNGRFFVPADGDTARFADCIVVDSSTGLIFHVGSEADEAVTQAAAAGASRKDMRNQVVLPGLIDSHMHILQTGEALQKLSLGGCKSLDEIRAAIKNFALANPDAPRLLCRSWRHGATGGGELASHLDDLDPRPIYIDADDLHSTWCNSAALKEIGAADMEDPTGGKIHRDEQGKPSGLMSETAAIGIVWPFLSSLTTPNQRLGYLEDAFNAYIRAGYTGVVEMATDEGVWNVLQAYRKKHGELPFWLAAHWFVFPRDTSEETLAQVDRAIELRKEFNKDSAPSCRIAGIKVMCDGVVDACTAHLLEAYSHSGENELPAWTVEKLVPVLRKADTVGMQCALHAIGDGAIRIAIDSLEAINNPEARHRIEHLEMCTPEDTQRLGKLGITASVQPVHLDPSGLGQWKKLIGTNRCKHIFPYGAFEKFGATVAIGTDCPTAPYDPLPNLYLATTRKSVQDTTMQEATTPEFALSLASAVTASTLGAARSCFEETTVGSLKAGWRANLTVVDMEWDANKLLQAKVTETWVAGKKIFAAGV